MDPDVELGEAGGLAYPPGPNQHEEWGELETPDRCWPVGARWLEEETKP